MNASSIRLADPRPADVAVRPTGLSQRSFLGPGSRCRYDGQAWTVQSWTGQAAVLEADDGSRREVLLWDLVHEIHEQLVEAATVAGDAGDPDEKVKWTEPATFTMESPGAAGWLLDVLPPGDAAALDEQVQHMNEVVCGYRRGSASLALPHEPRPEYAPGTSDHQRAKAKAAELGISRFHVDRLVGRYKEHGPAGLIRRGLLKQSAPLVGCTEEFLRAVVEVCHEHIELSTVTQAVVLAAVERRLEAKHGAGKVDMPKRTKAYQILNIIGKPLGLFGGSSKNRRNMANSPKGTYGELTATRPGEYLLLDTTVLDVFAMDRRTGKWVRLELTVAIDLFTRSVVAMRLTPFTTKARDIAGLLYDCVRPKQMRPGWPRRAAWRYHGLPSNVVVDITQLVDEQGEELAGVPPLAIETIVVDHGKVFISRLVRSVCTRLGISIQPARPYTPTDKAVVERWFLTLRTGLLQCLPGYKGPDVYSRGKDVENQAFYFIDELEEILWEWVTAIHQTRPHKGLTFPEMPGRFLTPNEAYEIGIQRAGFVAVPARADLAFEFLPIKWVTVSHDGFWFEDLHYNGDALRNARGMPGPRPADHGKRWPVWIDDDDRSQAWFRDPFDGTVRTVPWVHAHKVGGPFSDDMLAEAKRIIVAEHRDPADLAAVLKEMRDRWAAGGADGAVARKMAARNEQKERTSKAASVTDKQVERAFPRGRPDPADEEPAPERKAPPVGKAGAPRLVSVPTSPDAVDSDDDDPSELEDDDQLLQDPAEHGDYYDDALGVF